MELLLAVFGEWERGVRLGARSVRIAAVVTGLVLEGIAFLWIRSLLEVA